MSRHFDYDLSNDYTQPFKDKFWLQQTIQVQTAEGPAETKACMRDLDDSLRKALHDKHKLGHRVLLYNQTLQPQHDHLKSNQQVKSSARFFTKLNSNFAQTRSHTRTEAERKSHT